MIALEEIQSTKRNCDQCNHTLESQKESLKQPSIIFQSRTIETHLYPCETCEFTSISREDMTAHANSRESYQFNCNLCGFVATSQENIDANIGAHHETEQLESFSCDQCDYETIFQDNLLVHECGDTNTVLNLSTQYSCDQCDYKLLLE